MSMPKLAWITINLGIYQINQWLPLWAGPKSTYLRPWSFFFFKSIFFSFVCKGRWFGNWCASSGKPAAPCSDEKERKIIIIIIQFLQKNIKCLKKYLPYIKKCSARSSRARSAASLAAHLALRLTVKITRKEKRPTARHKQATLIKDWCCGVR